jgi:hypothetical protein
MDFNMQSMSARLSNLGGIPPILEFIASLEADKEALRRKLYPRSTPGKETSFNLLDLPVEIQLLIIREHIQDWQLVGQTPDLIKALRGESNLYQEALAIFYGTSTVTISDNNEHRVLEMPKSLLKRAVSLELWYG